MPVLDSCHPQIVHALEKAGWDVSPGPFVLHLDKRHRLHIDIEAYNDQEAIIVVEVKCFTDIQSETTELYTAIGQYLVYQDLLNQKSIEIPLYLAVPSFAYEGIFRRMAMGITARNNVKMIVVDITNEAILEWIR
jgi:hypothetical protein